MPGAQGTTGAGVQGIQGPGGSTTEVEVDNIHTSGLQTTAMFLTLVQGGSGARPLYGTTGPNPEQADPEVDGTNNTDLETNMYYTSSLDELTVENIDVKGAITLDNVTRTTWPTGGGGSGTLSNIVEDTTPQLGGNLDGQAFTITTSSDITAANFNSTSDATRKENVVTIINALDTVSSLRGVNFDWIETGLAATGVIAQEVEEIVPQVVDTHDDGMKTVAYGNLVGLLIEAIKELKAEVEDLKQ